MFFRLNSWALGLILFAVVLGATALGVVLGRSLRRLKDDLREPFGVLQAALLGIVGLLLAFGLSLAIGRYETRRAATVDEANAIGTTYLRAQTLAEPIRAKSIALLRRYNDEAIRIAHEIPGGAGMRRTVAQEGVLQRQLWELAGTAMNEGPVASAPRLYMETLNDMIDHADRARLGAQQPGAVRGADPRGRSASALALGHACALPVDPSGRGPVTVLVRGACL